MMPRLILASASSARGALLQGAGIDFQAIPADIDEGAIKRAFEGQPAARIATEIATAKAQKIAAKKPDQLVLGSDQVLVHRGRLFSKPRTLAEARTHLEDLSGNAHRLVSAAAIVRNDQILWHDNQTVTMTMRPLSPAFLDRYLQDIGDLALNSVGCYHLEGRGSQLFSSVDGDYFAVLGLPLLPLLQALRNLGYLSE